MFFTSINLDPYIYNLIYIFDINIKKFIIFDMGTLLTDYFCRTFYVPF
ncbi:Uncharacterised protein [Anaerobiospirillum thomasii]|uniref:Uncharacterized protein n=1 Tax=Anaerobiospirillum thomasii TaxID=179995 RepID=A0A2X0V8S4_9GAMM|nr:Uncharacterised protein [Anaerobiospirillum thomasii]SPT71907.1 Uncharacterised protein [Anaerobiospirillum thomasii]